MLKLVEKEHFGDEFKEFFQCLLEIIIKLKDCEELPGFYTKEGDCDSTRFNEIIEKIRALWIYLKDDPLQLKEALDEYGMLPDNLIVAEDPNKTPEIKPIYTKIINMLPSIKNEGGIILEAFWGNEHHLIGLNGELLYSIERIAPSNEYDDPEKRSISLGVNSLLLDYAWGGDHEDNNDYENATIYSYKNLPEERTNILGSQNSIETRKIVEITDDFTIRNKEYFPYFNEFYWQKRKLINEIADSTDPVNRAIECIIREEKEIYSYLPKPIRENLDVLFALFFKDFIISGANDRLNILENNTSIIRNIRDKTFERDFPATILETLDKNRMLIKDVINNEGEPYSYVTIPNYIELNLSLIDDIMNKKVGSHVSETIPLIKKLFRRNTHQLWKNHSAFCDIFQTSSNNFTRLLKLNTGRYEDMFLLFPDILQYIDGPIINDKMMFHQFVKNGFYFSTAHIESELLNDREVALAVLDNVDSIPPQFFNLFETDREFLRLALSKNPDWYFLIDDRFKEDEELTRIFLSKIKVWPKDEEIIANTPFSIFNAEILKRHPERRIAFVKEMLTINPNLFVCLDEVWKNDRELVLTFFRNVSWHWDIEKGIESTVSAFSKDPEIMKLYINNAGGDIRKIDIELTGNRDFLVTLIENGLQFNQVESYFSEEKRLIHFLNEPELVIKMLRNNPTDFDRIPEQLKKDDVFMQALKNGEAGFGLMFQHGDNETRNNKDIFEKALLESNGYFRFAGNDILADTDYLIHIFKSHPVCFFKLSDGYAKDKVCKRCIELNLYGRYDKIKDEDLPF